MIVSSRSRTLISDPPFSKLDLISCRNLLIYMNTDLQKRLIHLFHYALKPNGFLFLGTSESVGSYSEYIPLDRSKMEAVSAQGNERSGATSGPGVSRGRGIARDQSRIENDEIYSFRELAEKALLDNYPAAGVVIDEKHEIIYFYGSTGKYLSPPSGEASFNLLENGPGRPEIRIGQFRAQGPGREQSSNASCFAPEN